MDANNDGFLTTDEMRQPEKRELEHIDPSRRWIRTATVKLRVKSGRDRPKSSIRLDANHDGVVKTDELKVRGGNASAIVSFDQRMLHTQKASGATDSASRLTLFFSVTGMARQLGFNLFPILQELCQSDIGQGCFRSCSITLNGIVEIIRTDARGFNDSAADGEMLAARISRLEMVVVEDLSNLTTRAIPSCPISSRRPINGLTKLEPALADIRA
jgi:hypothetical protein